VPTDKLPSGGGEGRERQFAFVVIPPRLAGLTGTEWPFDVINKGDQAGDGGRLRLQESLPRVPQFFG
jgi:hypothetical protein